ncbi:hypothetical protein Q1695_006001 [Nippostrongylus brasiliensis]|nr:hypothetical protein Q1695_006001 [Nippostrongylus brasiliensis]
MWLDIGGLLNVSVVIGLTMVVILFCGIGTRGNVVGILLTLYPVLEPLVILSCDTNYREAIKMYLGVLKYTSNRRCSVSAIKF